MAEAPAPPPAIGPESPGAFQKKEFARIVNEVTAAHPEASTVELWFEDEARAGQKGRVSHRWYERGQRPRGLHDQGFKSAFIFAAACPARDTGAAIVITQAATVSMNLLLREVSRTVAPGAHAVLFLDRAGWHTSGSLEVPPNITLAFLPPYAPELNPVERIWEYLRENRLSHRVFTTVDDIIDACCAAWNSLLTETGRIQSLCSYPWIA